MGQFQNVPGPSQDEFNAQTQAIANLETPTTILNVGPSGHESSAIVRKVGRICFLEIAGAFWATDTLPVGYRPASGYNWFGSAFAGSGGNRYPAHLSFYNNKVSAYLHQSGGETGISANGQTNLYGNIIYISDS